LLLEGKGSERINERVGGKPIDHLLNYRLVL